MRFVLTAVLIGLFAAVPAQAKPRLCDARPGETVAATDAVRVFRDGAVLRGCRHGSRATLRLARNAGCGIGPIAAAGRYVAVVQRPCNGGANVVLFDVKQLRDIVGVAAFDGEIFSGDTVTVPELAVTRVGAVAWIAGSSGAGELHLRRPFADVPEVIASGGELSDLALTAHKLFWLKNGQTQAVDL
jgi:hypothetical protein